MSCIVTRRHFLSRHVYRPERRQFSQCWIAPCAREDRPQNDVICRTMGCGPSRVSITRLKLQRRKQSTHDSVSNHNNNNNNKKNQQDSTKFKPNSSIRRRPSESDTVSKSSPNDLYVQRSSHLSEDIGIAKKRIANKIRPISGPLQPPLHRSSSQIDFFRMLDEKIDSGKDYNSDDDACSRKSGASHRTRSSTSPCDMRANRERLSKGDS